MPYVVSAFCFHQCWANRVSNPSGQDRKHFTLAVLAEILMSRACYGQMKTVSEPRGWWQECHLCCGLPGGAAQLVAFGLGNSGMILGSSKQR